MDRRVAGGASRAEDARVSVGQRDRTGQPDARLPEERLDGRQVRAEAPAQGQPQAQAREIDSAPSRLPLAGLTLGVKDIIDVGGLRCEFGSPIYRGRLAFSDAALVATLKSLGIVVVGKAVTTEFAYRTPGGAHPLFCLAVRGVDALSADQIASCRSWINPAATCR